MKRALCLIAVVLVVLAGVYVMHKHHARKSFMVPTLDLGEPSPLSEWEKEITFDVNELAYDGKNQARVMAAKEPDKSFDDVLSGETPLEYATRPHKEESYLWVCYVVLGFIGVATVIQWLRKRKARTQEE